MLTSVPLSSMPVSDLAQSGTADAPAPFEFPELPQASRAPDQAGARACSTGPFCMPAVAAEPVASQPAMGRLSGWELGSSAPAAAAASSGATVDADIGMPAIEQEGPSQLVQSGTIQAKPLQHSHFSCRQLLKQLFLHDFLMNAGGRPACHASLHVWNVVEGRGQMSAWT